MKAKQAVILAVLLLFAGMAPCHADPQTITVPSGTLQSGDNWFSLNATPYDPAPGSVLANIWPCAVDELTVDQIGMPTDVFHMGAGYSVAVNTTPGSFSFQGFMNVGTTDMWVGFTPTSTANGLGSPFADPVSWSSVLATDGSTVWNLTDSLQPGDILGYTPGLGEYAVNFQVESLQPWKGYKIAWGPDIAVIIPRPNSVPPPNTGDIWQAKQQPDDTYVVITDAIVTQECLYGCYIEQPNRACGIRVDWVWDPVGTKVTVDGNIYTDPATGERYINGGLVTDSPGDPCEPLGMALRSVGGMDWNYDSQTGAGQQGVFNGYGVNNIGMLAHVWGKTVYTGELNSFMLDDGLGNAVKCVLPWGESVPLRRDWDYLDVTGIVSCYKDESGDVRPQILLPSGITESNLLYKKPYTYSAQVVVDTNSTIGTVDPLLCGYGFFGSDMSDTLDGRSYNSSLRTVTSGMQVTSDFLSYVQALKPRMFRYEADNTCHWRMGVGPKLKRCRPIDEFNPWDVDLFGTDELRRLCYDLSPTNASERPDPIMCANVLQAGPKGLGNTLPTGIAGSIIQDASVQEAANWVEYCNGEVTQTLLNTAASQGWEPSEYMINGVEATAQQYATTETADGVHSWLSYATTASMPSPAPNPAPPTGYYNCPTGYFAWLRRYYAWLEAGSPMVDGVETWKSLNDFEEASYVSENKIKYWELGNEVYWNDQYSTLALPTNSGEKYLTGTSYASLANTYAEAMKAKDPSIKVGVCVIGQKQWAYGYGSEYWDRDVIENVQHANPALIDFVIPHYYSTIQSRQFEQFQGMPVSTRTITVPEWGDYQFKVVGTGWAEGGLQYPVRFKVSVPGAYKEFPLTSVPTDLDSIEPFSVYLGPGQVTITMENLRMGPPPGNAFYQCTANVYSLLMKRPGSSRWEDILFPEDTEMQRICNEEVDTGRMLTNTDLDPVNESGYAPEAWGLKDRLAHANKADMDIIVTEANFGMGEHGESQGYPHKQVSGVFKYKGAFWVPAYLRTMIRQGVKGVTFHTLMDDGYWGVIRNPLGNYSGFPPYNQYVSTVTPSYWALTMWAKLQGGTAYEVNLGNTPTFYYPGAPFPPPNRINRFGGSAAGWNEPWKSPEDIPWLDAIAVVKDTETLHKLYLLVSNRKPEYASAAINTGGLSVQSTATVSTLHIKNLVNSSVPFLTWNLDPEMEAHSETYVQPTTGGTVETVYPDTIGMDSDTIGNASSSFTYAFEPYSVTLIEFTLQ